MAPSENHITLYATLIFPWLYKIQNDMHENVHFGNSSADPFKLKCIVFYCTHSLVCGNVFIEKLHTILAFNRLHINIHMSWKCATKSMICNAISDCDCQMNLERAVLIWINTRALPGNVLVLCLIRLY